MAQATPFDTILVQSRDLFRDRLVEAVATMLDGADASLSDLAEKTKDEEEQKRFLDARDLAIANRDVIEGQFKQRYLGEFQKSTKKAKKIGESISDFSLDDLALVGEDDLNETLKFNAMAEKLRRYCDDELSALDQRVGVLLGDAGLEADDNPFGPKVICDAYKQACKQVECPVEIRMVLLKLFDDHVLDTIRSSYKEVNELLVENSILPKIRYGISKSESKAPSLTDKDKAAPGEPEVKSEDVFAQLAKMMGGGGAAGAGAGGGGPGMGVGGMPLVQGAELMSSLTQLQVGNLAALGEAAAELGPILAEAGNLKNVLHQLKSTSVGAGMGQVDAMTLDVVAMLFDQLFDDPKIPIALKGLIGRLQLPMLKVAIADKDLFTKKTHPARQLLDVLGQIGLRLPPDFDQSSALFPRLEAFIQELEKGFQEKMEIFDKVRADLEAIVAEDDKRVAEAMQAEEKQLQQAESLAVAKAVAQDEILARVQASPNAPRPVVEFLAQQWIKPLVIAHARDGKESAAWKGALETIDMLLASVAPKATMEDRRGLARTIPPLLKRLKEGASAGGIDQAASAAFLAELMKCHTELMQPPAPQPVKKEVAPAPLKEKVGAGAAAPRPAAKPAAAPAAKAVAEELDFTAPVVLDNPFGGGKVEVSSEELDFTADAAPALAEPTAPDASKAPTGRITVPTRGRKRAMIHLPTAMIMGAWVEVADADTDTRRAARLHYVSPKKSHFLFVDRQGKKVFECSRSILARRLKLGEVTLLEGEPDSSLFDRLMSGIFGKLGTTAPA